MRDVFYTLLVVWIVSRILSSVNTVRSKTTNKTPSASRKEGKATVEYMPPQKKSVVDTEGEYVDFEEIK